MECLGPQCAAMLLEWLQTQRDAAVGPSVAKPGPSAPAALPGRQGLLWGSVPYQDDAPAIRSEAELAGAIEHLQYAVFRRYQNQLTKAERARLDNTILNSLFKIDRYAERLEDGDRAKVEAECRGMREQVRDGREMADKLRLQGRRAELKLTQLASLTPEGSRSLSARSSRLSASRLSMSGGTGDQGVDLRVCRGGLNGIVQCKYFSRGVVGSPELQKFLGTIHHTKSHKGFFVTTRTFTLAADKFASEHPIELIDGPRLVELVQEAMGPGARKEPEPAWF